MCIAVYQVVLAVLTAGIIAAAVGWFCYGLGARDEVRRILKRYEKIECQTH